MNSTKITSEALPAGNEASATTPNAAKKSRMTEARFRLAFENAPIGMAVVDFDYSLRRVNAALCKALGYTSHELLAKKFVEITHADDVVRDTNLADKLFRGEIPSYRIEKRFVRKDGTLAWLDVTAILIRGDNDDPLYGLAMVENITDRKRSDEALRTSEERYRSFVVNSSEGIWRFDLEQPVDVKLPADEQLSLFYKYAYLAECNDAMARMHGYERADDIVGLRFGDTGFASHPANISSMRKLISGNYRLIDLQTEDLVPDGSVRHFLTNLIGIVINDRLVRIWGVQRDQTEQKKIALRLEHSHEQLRFLSGHLQALREVEKSNLARELHDTIGQSLASIKIETTLLRKKLGGKEEVDREELVNRLAELGSSLDETILSVKAIATELRPGVLDKFGLPAAIEWQCEEFARRMEIDCKCIVPAVEVNIKNEVSTALFRILQEALTNVVQYSNAKAVQVDLTVDESRVSLTVNDNGRGITEDEIKAPTSLGLLGMRERIEFLHGSFSIAGHAGRGTTIRATIPVKSS
jgi:PAS domain S-box-containing protein